MKYLILGANGYIGGYLFKRMKADGMKVTGTARDCRENQDFIRFDILHDSIDKIVECIGGKEKTAVICIARTSIDQCRLEYETSRQINVTATKKIIDMLIHKNFHVIYFSTDNVFDGTKGNYTEQDITGAINQYGKMKAEMERFLTEKYPEVCIFRLPKVVGVEKENKNMLTDLENHLDDEIRCIKGTKMSIVSKEDVYQACLIASEWKMKGIYNLSSGEVLSRKELAERFYQYMGIYDKDFAEIELEEFHFMDARPLKIWLDNSKFRRETGYEFEPFEAIAQRYVLGGKK